MSKDKYNQSKQSEARREEPAKANLIPREYCNQSGSVILSIEHERIKAYDALLETWGKCQKCPLGTVRKNVSFVRGNLPCDVLFVGDTPSLADDAEGFPLMGPSGRLLDSILTELKRSRPDWTWAIANPLGCIAYAATEADQEPTSTRRPLAGELEACYGRFVGILELASPRGVVLLGKTAEDFWVKYAVDIKGRMGGNVPLTQCQHPTAVLRAGGSNGNAMYRATLSNLKQFLFQTLNVGRGG